MSSFSFCRIILDSVREKRKEILDPQNPRDFMDIYLTQKENLDEQKFASNLFNLNLTTKLFPSSLSGTRAQLFLLTLSLFWRMVF